MSTAQPAAVSYLARYAGRTSGGDLPVDVADVEPGQQPVPGHVGQVFVAAAQQAPDPVQRVVLASTPAQDRPSCDDHEFHDGGISCYCFRTL
jgi:hypothetical protein